MLGKALKLSIRWDDQRLTGCRLQSGGKKWSSKNLVIRQFQTHTQVERTTLWAHP